MAKEKKEKKVNPSKVVQIKATFTEENLGTASSDPDLHGTYVASKAPTPKLTKEEMEALTKAAEEKALKEEADAPAKPPEEKTMTIFSRENGQPILYDYQFKGFMKDACGMLARIAASLSYELTAYKKTIDGLIFPLERKIQLVMPKGSVIGHCQRPLRAQTAQGERIAIAHSETVPAGTVVVVNILLLDGDLEPVLREWFTYGRLRGMGQWRNSGKGRLLHEIVSVKEIPFIEALMMVPEGRVAGLTPEGQPVEPASV